MNGARHPGVVHSLRYRDFRLLLADTTLQQVVLPMHFITLTFWAIERYPDEKVLYTSLIVAVRGAGLILLSLIGGAIADRIERRRVIQGCEVALFVNTLAIAATIFFEPLGDATIVLVLGLVFAAAANMGIDAPARSASIPAIVPQQQMGAAIGFNNIAQQITVPITLPLVGLINGLLEPGQVILVSLLAWAGIFPIVFSLRYSSRAAARPAANITRDVVDGLRYVGTDRTIQAVVLIMIIVQVIGMPTVGMLGPVWVTEVLGLSRAQFGLVAMVWGIGGLTSSIVFTRLLSAARRGPTLVATAMLFGTAALIFSLSRLPLLTAAMNFFLGFALAGTIVVALTIVQYRVPNEMRGRVTGLFPLVLGMAMLNAFPVGAAGQRAGLEIVFPALALCVLCLTALLAMLLPALRTRGAVQPAVAVEAGPAAAAPVAALQPEEV